MNNFLFFLKDPSKEFLKKILNSPSLTPMEKFGAVAEHYSSLKSQDPLKRKIAMIFQKLEDGIPTDVALRIENTAITAYKKKWAGQYEYKDFAEKSKADLKNRINSQIESLLKNVIHNPLFPFFRDSNPDPINDSLKKIKNDRNLTAFEKFGAIAEYYSQLKKQKDISAQEKSWLGKIGTVVFQPLGNGIPADQFLAVEFEAKNAYHRKIEPLADTMEVNL
ncbi:hypothetical protein FOG18_08240 [Legionella israelensis]|uniref:hypothetical protein n=1 Tax=Legionella israelensis TaxID=454 RepID=UPI00117C5EEB|nr:hypothetical protein [Legionella israelensis]QDP72544.1 hypothetical protein FOG18_08240 [Legionella israelensis]